MVQVLGIESLSGVAKCEKVTEICITAFQNAEDKKIADSFDALKRKRVTSTSQPALSSSNVTSCCDPKQPKINAALAERSKAEADEAVASTGIRFNIVNNTHFRQMCQTIG